LYYLRIRAVVWLIIFGADMKDSRKTGGVMKYAGRTLLVSCFFILVVAGSAYAQSMPKIPCDFYGFATINGRPVPSGSVITAQIDGVSKGMIAISSNGKYGGETLADTDHIFAVYDGASGDQVTFFVQTPDMSNRLEASEKGTWQEGGTVKLDLTFTGQEIPRTESPAPAGNSGNGGSGNDNSGASVNVTAPVVDEQQFQNQGKTYDITGNISSGNASLNLGKGDEVKFSYNGKDVSIKVKSMSDFAVLFSTPGGDVVIAEKGSGQADIDGDGFAELQISVGKVKNGAAESVFSLLAKPNNIITSGPGSTGMFFANGSGLWISVSAIVIIGIIGSGIYLWRRRGVRNESVQ
jgi:hypothetical protein